MAVPPSPVACGQAVHALVAMPTDALSAGAAPSNGHSLVLAAGRDKTIRAYSEAGVLCMQHSAHIDRIWSLAVLGERRRERRVDWTDCHRHHQDRTDCLSL